MARLRRTADAVAVPLGAAAIGALAWRATHPKPVPARTGAADSPRPAPARGASLPRVSVLVAAWNEAEHVEALVDSFLAVTYPDAELIVCAGGDDGTFELASGRVGDRVRVLPQVAGDGKQGGLRRAYRAARGEIVMLTDADCCLVDEAFWRLLAPLLAGEYAAATGGSEPPLRQRAAGLVAYQWLVDRWWQQQLPDETDGLLGRNCAVTRAALDRVGAFDADVPTGTDYHLARALRRAGYRIRTVPASRVLSDYPADARGYLRMYERWHKNLLIHGPRFGAWGDVRALLTAFVAYGLALGLPLAAPIAGRAAIVGSGVLLATAVAQRFARVEAGARAAGLPPPRALFPTVVAATALDMAAVFLAVYAAINPRRRWRW